MKQKQLRKYYFHAKRRFLTTNNFVIIVALVIGASWAWGSIGMMQRNYTLQKTVDSKARERTLAKLQVETLAYQQKYYQSSEYKELSAREHLGLANPGEKVLLLPPNSDSVKKQSSKEQTNTQFTPRKPSNSEQWINFLFGGNRRT